MENIFQAWISLFGVFGMIGFIYCLLMILDLFCSTSIESKVSSPVQQEAGIRILKESEREAVLEAVFANAASSSNISYNSYQRGPGFFGFGSHSSNRRSEQVGYACCICLNSLDHGAGVMTGTCCSHMFHYDCIMEWLIRGKDDCPICRKPMMTADEFRSAALQVLGENHHAVLTVEEESNLLS